jgi:hypothetical protein
MRERRTLGTGLSLAGLVAACAFGTSVGPAGMAAGARDGVDSCPRLAEAAKLPERRGAGVLRGDVDGDGVHDRVAIRFAPRARASCGFLLVVETHNRILAARVREWYKPPQDLPIRQWPFAEPFVAVIVRLDAHRSQVVVARGHGASVVNVSLYGIVDGKLEVLHFPRKLYRDELSLFGSVGTGDTNARCRWRGPLIVLSRSPTSLTGRRWRFARTDYRLAGSRFSIIRERSTVVSEAEATKVSQRWHFDVKPFTGCAVARGRRL